MEEFSQKLQLIYTKIFDEDIDKFTESFIDYSKFKREKNTKEEFLNNRKIVLRRWLLKGISCTSDFQKSFKNYKISHYKIGVEPLFRLEDFKNGNRAYFEKRLNSYMEYTQRAYVNSDYRYIYKFNELLEKIDTYEITAWKKSKEEEIVIDIEYNHNIYKGTFASHDENSIFIIMNIDNITHYLLFHDNNDSNYIVGTSMGYLPTDTKVPKSQKVIFSKQRLDSKDIKYQFILNEVESISAIENRFNPNMQEIKINPFVKYHNHFKKYHRLFSRILSSKFQQSLYYRLAFREFYAFKRLFEKVSRGESYFVFNYDRAFFQLIKTVENIQNTPLYIVMEFNHNNIFLELNCKAKEIQNRFFELSSFGVETTVIFVIDSIDKSHIGLEKVLEKMKKHSIDVRLIEKESIVHEVNSLDFMFIHIGDERDFVLADPLRDSKDVFKLFIDEVTMDEYRIDYGKILDNSFKGDNLCI